MTGGLVQIYIGHARTGMGHASEPAPQAPMQLCQNGVGV